MKPILLLCFALSFSPLFSQDCLPDWDYYFEVTIDNSGGEALTDYQIKLELNTGDLVTAGKLNTDGSDLRFTDASCNLLHYFMDSLATSTANHIWVKVPEITAASTTTFRAYYGNSSAAPYANGDSTFVFFDDFSSGEVDPTKWEPIGEYATLEVIDGVLAYSSTQANPGPRFKFVRTTEAFNDPLLFDFAAEISNGAGFGFSNADIEIDRILYRQSGFGFDTLNQVAHMWDTITNGVSVSQEYPLLRFPRGIMTNGSIQASINGMDRLQTTLFANLDIPGEENTDTFTLVSTTMTGYHFILSSFSPNLVVRLDYLRVRQPAANPPETTAGAEQMNEATSVFELLPESAVQLFPNPSNGFFHIVHDFGESVRFAVYDLSGKQLLFPQLLPSSTSLQLDNLSAGNYWILFYPEDTEFPFAGKKLIIAK